MFYNFDNAYKHIANSILTRGQRQVISMNSGLQETLSLFNTSWTFSGCCVPLLSLRQINVELLIKELRWIISGSSNIQPLGSHQFIWAPWADSQGNLESSYGRLLKHFPVSRGNLGSLYGNPGLNQIVHLKRALSQPFPSRRIQLTLAHPEDLALSNLPPCMSGLGLNWWTDPNQPGVRQVSLNIKFRSSDFCVGFVFDIFQWYLFTQVLLNEVNLLNPGLNYQLAEYTFSADNQHIYSQHLGPLGQLLERPSSSTTYWLPSSAIRHSHYSWLSISPESTLDNFDYTLAGYEPFKHMKFQLID